MSAPTTNSLQARSTVTPTLGPPAGIQPAASQTTTDSQRMLAGGDHLLTGQQEDDAHHGFAGGGQLAVSPTCHDAHGPCADGTSPPVGHTSTGNHSPHADGGASSPQAKRAPTPTDAAPAGSQTDGGGQRFADAHMACAPVVPDQPTGHGTDDAQSNPAGGSQQGQPASDPATPVLPALADPTLALAADILDDLERVKIANANRLRSLTRDAEDSDGEMRGFGLDPSHPDVARLAALVEMLEKAEHDATLNLKRAMRKHPLGPWVKAQKGIGEKQAARLLAVIGDPYINGSTGQPRTVSQLWAYSGLHVLPSGQGLNGTHPPAAAGSSSAGGDPSQTQRDTQSLPAGVAARRTKGQRANWSTLAKTRAWLVVQACMKQLDPACKSDTGIADHTDDCACSPYRVVIDERRKHTATTHPEWSPGHSLNDAMRIASKRLLRDLWREARDLHHATEGH